jgi:hypothetical protein
MEKDELAVADHLRNQLGVFYWTMRRGGDLEIAARQLQTEVCWTERETLSWCRCTPPTLFMRWSQTQLMSLLGEAKQVLSRVDQCLAVREPLENVRLGERRAHGDTPEVFTEVVSGPLA